MGTGISFGAILAGTTPTQPSSGLTATSGNSAVQDFLAYMKETPAQRMEDSWLAAHGLTRDALNAMPPAQREAVLKQMAQDIADETKQQAADAAQSKRSTEA
jgi:hypothetical protein